MSGHPPQRGCCKKTQNFRRRHSKGATPRLASWIYITRLRPMRRGRICGNIITLLVSLVNHWVLRSELIMNLVQDNTFKNNDVVFVKGRTESGTEAQDFWVARILQVRAKSSQQV